MTLMKTVKLEFVVMTVCLMILIPVAMSRPSTEISSGDNIKWKSVSVLDENTATDAQLQKAIDKLLLSEEHKELRRLLKIAVMSLDNPGEQNEISEFVKNMKTSDMPFYFDYIKSLVSGKAIKRRSHRKRASFDSIAHRAGSLGGLGGSYTGSRVDYSLEQLIPFIIAELRKNNEKFGTPDFHF